MLDHDIDMAPESWQTAWLDRDLYPLRCYTTLTSYLLSLTIIGLGVGGFVAIRRRTGALVAEPDNRGRIFQAMKGKLLGVTKGHFWVAVAYLAQVVVLTLIDATIALISIKNDYTTHPETWNRTLLLEILTLTLHLLALFCASFILLPLAQITLTAHLLPTTTLATYLPEARFLSTHLAQLWAMGAFFTVAWWAPSSDETCVARFVVLLACLGSAVVWLEVSFALNFRFERLVERGWSPSKGGVREVVGFVWETVGVVHGDDGKVELPVREVEVGLTKEEREVL